MTRTIFLYQVNHYKKIADHIILAQGKYRIKIYPIDHIILAPGKYRIKINPIDSL